MEAPLQPGSPIAASSFAQRKARALIGWLSPEEGALWLSGRVTSQTRNQEHLDRCHRAREAVASRGTGVDQISVFQPLPVGLEAHIEKLRGHPSSAQILAVSGQPMLVDLSKVCAAQPQIHTEDATKRVEGLGSDDLDRIIQITLPIPTTEVLPVAFDSAKNAWLISSPNPNLRVVGNFSAEVGPGMTGLGFGVALQKSYLQVAGLGGRFFLRDGYHRAYGLLAAGIRFAPALVKEFASFEEVGLPPGLLPQNAYLGERPPLLKDYLDNEVAADTEIPMTQKMIVIQALEINSLG